MKFFIAVALGLVACSSAPTQKVPGVNSSDPILGNEKTYEPGVISPNSNGLEALERRAEKGDEQIKKPSPRGVKREQAGRVAKPEPPKPVVPDFDPGYETEAEYENSPTR